jgi:hypothetical protein
MYPCRPANAVEEQIAVLQELDDSVGTVVEVIVPEKSPMHGFTAVPIQVGDFPSILL